jgi:hypothetical protein
LLPRDQAGEAESRRFDFMGLALATLGVVAIIYALKLVTTMNPGTMTATNPTGTLYGWDYWLVWVLLGAGVLLLLAFAFYSLRLSRDPALDLRQFRRRDFLVSSLFNWAIALVILGLLVLLPLYFEAVRLPTLSPLDTGLAGLPFGIGSLVGTAGAMLLYRAIGPRWVVFLGAVLAALSAWVLAHTIQPTATASQLVAAVQTQTPIPAVAGAPAVRWGLFLFGLSFTFMLMTVQTLALEALKGEALAKASSLFLSTRQIFYAAGVAIVTTLFVALTQSRATDLVNQGMALVKRAGIDLSTPRGVATRLTIAPQIATQAGTWAVQSIFWLIFFGSLGLIVLALLLPGRKRRSSAAQTEETLAKEEPEPAAATPV